jgi:hypothetical protein
MIIDLTLFPCILSWNRIVVVVGEREATELVVAGWLARRTACIIKKEICGWWWKRALTWVKSW